MPMHAAIPEQLEALGQTLRAQIDAINGVVSTVTNALANTVWEGPARDQFQADWDGSFRTALNQLNAAFEAAGNGCVTRAANTRAVLGLG